MRRRRLLGLLPGVLAPVVWSPVAMAGVRVLEIRLWHAPDRTRLVFDLSANASYKVFPLVNPERLVIDFRDTDYRGDLPGQNKSGPLIEKIRGGRPQPGVARFVLDMNQSTRHTVNLLKPVAGRPYRLVIDITSRSRQEAPVATAPPEDLVVVLDPGHGGEDPGALGKRVKEKEVVLKIASRLKDKLNRIQGIRAHLTRDGDYYIKLRKRIAIARKYHADLFVSIHADAHRNKRARGASVYALSQHGATSEQARWLANKENAADLVGGVSLDDKDDLLAQVLLDMSMDKTIEHSMKFGRTVLSELKQVGRVHSRVVEQAGFAVLKSPDIPSILVETAYITNPQEEKLLRSSRYQEQLATAILQGIRRYEPTLKKQYARG